jgi:hypothetical protein
MLLIRIHKLSPADCPRSYAGRRALRRPLPAASLPISWVRSSYVILCYCYPAKRTRQRIRAGSLLGAKVTILRYR